MIFQYRCDKCGVIEIDHKVGMTISKCPNCNNNIKRVYTPLGIVFTGEPGTSGFHTVDYGEDFDKQKRLRDHGEKLNKVIE